jgi:hypothetical protein
MTRQLPENTFSQFSDNLEEVIENFKNYTKIAP